MIADHELLKLLLLLECFKLFSEEPLRQRMDQKHILIFVKIIIKKFLTLGIFPPATFDKNLRTQLWARPYLVNSLGISGALILLGACLKWLSRAGRG